MKKQGLNYLLTLAIFLGMSSLAPQAVSAIFVLTPQGTLPTQVPVDGQVTASYTVYNNTPFVSPDNGLNYTGNAPDTTPAGVTQNTSASSNPPTCADPFTLSPYGSCTLVLTISGADLVNGQAIGGPKVCNTKDNPTICVLPDLNERLNVTTFTPGVPTVTGVSPNAGSPSGDTSVMITGTNFYGATAVTFGNIAATDYSVVSGTTITATTPANTGTVDVTVTTPEGTSDANPPYDQFTFEGSPTITNLSPNVGSTGGGTSVTLVGMNLYTASVVNFGSTAVSCVMPPYNCVVNSPMQITVLSPPASSTGEVDVTVVTTIGTSNAVPFTYESTPTVTSIVPNSGTDGTPVTINGTNFVGADEDDGSVTFGTVVFTSGYSVNPEGTQITGITAPAQGSMPSTVDIVVTTPLGESPTSANDQFTYTSATITNFTASGTYMDGAPPLVMISSDNGNTWAPVDATNLPANFIDLAVESIDCYDSATDCVAVGYYEPGQTDIPLIMYSTTSGSSWSGVLQSSISLPTDFESSAVLYSVYCDDSGDCTAVGYYYSSNDGGTYLPLILNNTNCSTGISWCAQPQSNITLPSDFSQNAQISAITCNGIDNCIMVGDYTNQASTIFPLILNNTTSCSTTWCPVQAINISLPDDAATGTNALISSVGCNYAGPSCFAGGYYSSNVTNSLVPLILNNVNNETAWTGVPQADIQEPGDFSFANPLNSVYCNGANCTITGSYFNSSGMELPYILNNVNTSNCVSPYVWCQPNSIAQPDDFASAGMLNSVNCAAGSGATIECAAVGSYFNGTDIVLLLLNSTDSSQDWSLGSYTPPPDVANNTILYSVTCTTGGICTAVGTFSSNVYGFAAPLFLSTTGGVDWTAAAASDIELPTDAIAGTIQINSNSCNGANCTSVGFYFSGDNSTNMPLILNSVDSGNSWTLPTGMVNLPAGGSDYQLFSVSCNGMDCTAVGGYTDNSGNNDSLILNSADNGNSWAPASSITFPQPPYPAPPIPAQVLNSVTCSAEGNCTAAGSYMGTYMGVNSNIPLILYSSTNGDTWTAASSIALPSNFTINGVIDGVSCSGAACTAVGVYHHGTHPTIVFALILYSTDSGNTWTPINDLQLPSDSGNIDKLLSVSCEASDCTAVGYYSNTSSNQFPLVYNSTNSGSTWSAPVAPGSFTLPDDFYTGSNFISTAEFYSVICSDGGQACTAIGNYSNDVTTIVPLIMNSTDGGNSWQAVETTNITEPDNFSSFGLLLGLSGR